MVEVKDENGNVIAEYYLDARLKKNLDEQVIKQLKTKDKDCVLVVDGKEGCISGDTIIRVSRAYLSRKYTIRWMYNQLHGNPDKLKISNKWNLNIPTFVRSFDGNRIRLHRIKDVLYSGKKKIYKLTLSSGEFIKATSNHEIMTNLGFVKLGKLNKYKHKIMCDDPKAKAGSNFKHKFHDIQIGGLIYHPSNRKRIEIHRIIYEAWLNKMELSKFIEILSDKEISKKLKFIKQNQVIHHKDFNHYNNNINNLACISINEHLKIHSKNNYKNFHQGIPRFSDIISIEYIGIEDTYDIKCCIPYHNFSANDIIISNSGKSTFAFQIGLYVDNTLDLSRVVFSPDEFREAILKAKKGQCIIYDEAFTGYSSRASLSPVNRVLVSLAMQMRQKNLFVIIVLPTIFLLDKYMAIFRTKALIHIWESKGRRGYFRLYNSKKKKLLILLGQKTMSYTHKGLWTNFIGRFFGKFALGDEKVEEEYRKNKEHALASSEKTSMTSAQVRFRDHRDLIMWLLRNYGNLTYYQMENLFADYELYLSGEQISRVCSKFGILSQEKIEKTRAIKQPDKKPLLNEKIFREKEEIKYK